MARRINGATKVLPADCTHSQVSSGGSRGGSRTKGGRGRGTLPAQGRPCSCIQQSGRWLGATSAVHGPSPLHGSIAGTAKLQLEVPRQPQLPAAKQRRASCAAASEHLLPLEELQEGEREGLGGLLLELERGGDDRGRENVFFCFFVCVCVWGVGGWVGVCGGGGGGGGAGEPDGRRTAGTQQAYRRLRAHRGTRRRWSRHHIPSQGGQATTGQADSPC